jgi:hypothetical protein
MACKVLRDEDGNIVKVKAPNERESTLYSSLLQSLGGEGNEEAAVRLWAKVYTPSFKSEFGDWEAFREAKEVKEPVGGLYKDIYPKDPEQGLWEAAVQANSSQNEREGATRIFGEKRIELALKIFPTAKVGDVYKSLFNNKLDKNGEPLASQVKLDEYKQLHGTEGSTASPHTLAKINEFLDRIGVKTKELQDIEVDGARIGANGVARTLAGLIEIAKGKEDIALPEEAMHFAVELIQQKNPELYRQMLNKVGHYKLYGKVLEDYNDIYKTKEGLPDVPKIKKEAIARVLAETVISKNEGSEESKERLLQTKGWWDKFVDWFRGLLGKAKMDPFEQTAEKILGGHENLGSAEDLVRDETYYQKKDNLRNKLIEEAARIGKDTKGAIVYSGEQVKRTVSSIIDKYYDEKRRTKLISENDAQKATREYKEATAGKGAADIDNILHRYIDDNNKLRDAVLAVDSPSELAPRNRTFYNTLEKNIAQRLNTYPGGTEFFHNLDVYDPKSGVTGNINLLAITPEGKIDILQFKFPNISNKGGVLGTYEQTAYNIEVEQLRKILESGYGVDKKDFTLTRAIPVKALYQYIDRERPAKGTILSGLKIGNINASLEKNESLLPVASPSESTGNKELDKLLGQMRDLLDRLQNEKVSPSEASQKGARIAGLLGAIRNLQVRRNSTKVIEGANLLVKRSEDTRAALSSQIEGADPKEMSLGQINKLAGDIRGAKENLLLYKDLDIAMERIYPSPDEAQKKFISDSGDIARKATRLIKDLEELQDTVRTKIMAVHMDIKDELNPEKAVTWWNGFIRSLSQSPLKAGAEMWKLVSRINDKTRTRLAERLSVLNEHFKPVTEWAKVNGGIEGVLGKLFAHDDKGRIQGRFISQTDSKFYQDLETAKKNGNHEWIKKNIDIPAYKEWYKGELSRRQEQAKTLRLDVDDEVNEKVVAKSLQDFEDHYDIDKKGVANSINWALNSNPRADLWRSKEFSELNKPENKPLLNLYNYWQDVLKQSHESGLLQSWERRTFFPNVMKDYIDGNLFSLKALGKSFINTIRIHDEGSSFGKQDALTGEPIDNIHTKYVSDLGKQAIDSDGNRFMDYSEKNFDLFRVMALWEKELLQYNLRTESEELAKLLVSTEQRKKSLAVDRSGNVKRDENGNILEIDNTANVKYLRDFLDATYYGKTASDQSGLNFKIPYGSAVEKINKLFGKEVLPVPTEKSIEVSGIKAIQTFNRYFSAKTLGLNPLTAIAHMWGGATNSYINSGKFFTKADLLEGQTRMVSGRFYDKEGKIQAGMIDYFTPFLEDRSGAQARNFSVNNAVKILSSDHLMGMLRTADKGVQYPIFLAFFNNTTIRDGKLVNIRELVKSQEGYATMYDLPYDQMKAKEADIEAKIQALKTTDNLFKLASIKDDKIILPGIERDSQTVDDFRQRIQQFTKDALGNVTHEDLSRYKMSVMWQSFFMFKNWIPRMVDVRFQPLQFNPGTDSYAWGRARMLYDAIKTDGLSTVGSLLKQLGGNDKNIIDIAKKLYTEKQAYFASQNQEFTMSEADFIGSYVKGVRSEFKELALATSLLGILVAARVNAPPKDEDPQIKGMYKWTLRAIDKLTDRLNFFYDPVSFTNIANGSVFPAISLLTDAQKLLTSGVKDAYHWSIGDEHGMKTIHPTKYFLKSLPIVNQVAGYTAIFNHDFAKQLGIEISSSASGK